MISFSSDLNKQFTTFASQTLETDILSDRERTLAVLAVTIALEDNNSIKQVIVAAKQMGISNEEIGSISAIVIAVRGLKIANFGLEIPTTQTKTTQSNCCR